MIKFIDLQTDKGFIFDGLWSLDINKDTGEYLQQSGYIFWFPNEQSTRLTYTMPICMYTDIAEPINISIEDNDIFSFIEHDTEDTECGGFRFKTPKYSTTYTTIPERIDDTHWLHVFHVSCKSDSTIEAICTVHIDKFGRIKIGADFYGDYEPVYVNLSNFGVELPDSIQKAIYDSNVHEDYKDNILINRKLKELLSNYWDVIANKGSYKSLLNSLDWFEWGNVLRLREVWKYNYADRSFFDDKEMCSLLEDKYISTLGDFIKTTYFSIYCSLYEDDNSYDSETNPELKQITFKWGKEDLALKISLLVEFFETFFMPIHTSILHGCVEDTVYTNTIKTLGVTVLNRTDSFMDNSYIKCNVKDGDIFKITNVNAQVTDDTVYGIRLNDIKDIFNEDKKTGKYINTEYENLSFEDVIEKHNGELPNDILEYFGVDYFGDRGLVRGKDDTTGSNDDNESIKSYSIQYYGGPGVIIPISLTIKNDSIHDFIQLTKITVKTDTNNRSYTFSDVIHPIGNRYNINFNFLSKEATNYTLQFMFVTAAGRTITKSLKFTTADVDNLHLQMYKVKSKDDSRGLTYEDFNDTKFNDFFFRIQPDTNDASQYCYTQYLPFMLPENPLYNTYNGKIFDGIKLSRTVIFDIQGKNGRSNPLSDNEIALIKRWMRPSFLEFERTDAGQITYLIYVSKKFYGDIPNLIKLKKYNTIRNSLGFYPQFHYLEKINGDTLNDFTITQYDAVCCGVEILTSNKNESQKFRYGHMIDKAEWSFRNSTTLDIVEHPVSVREPFVANTKSKTFIDGYYDIIFRYDISGVQHELSLNSAFRKKSI